MPVSYTNRKGMTYTLYRGQTRAGKPRYYFGRPGKGQGEPVTELPPGFTISESVNGVVSLFKDRPTLFQPEEVAAIEAVVQRHPEAHRYRVAVKRDKIEIYEYVGPDYGALLDELQPQAGTRGMSAFLVEKDSPGFSVGKVEHKMGIRGSQTTELVFTDCEVPEQSLLGSVGEGFKIAMATLDRTRPCVAALALGITQGAFEYAVEYVKTRTQFGKPIAEQQGIQFMVAEMATELEAARLLVYRAAMLIDRSRTEPELRFSKESAMAKMYASEVAVRVVDRALQLLGGYGYMTEYPLERMYRDVRITPIYEGTNQIQRLVIAREALR